MSEAFLVIIRVMAETTEDAIMKANDPVNRISVSAVRQQPNAVPITKDQWPMWAQALAQLATPEDKGIGDVVARMIGDERSEKFKSWYLVTFGKKCGCNGRQKLWNTKYPLNLKAT